MFILSATKFRKNDNGFAPLKRLTSSPSTIRMTVGKPRTRYRPASFIFSPSSTSTLASFIPPSYSSISRFNSGAMTRHGEHQSAHRSTNTGLRWDSASTNSSNASRSTLIIRESLIYHSYHQTKGCALYIDTSISRYNKRRQIIQ
jgi:hypothetical protein